MNPYQTYQQQQLTSATRIDLLLMLYDKAIGHLDQAHKALAQQNLLTATSRLLAAQAIVEALATGVDLQYGEIPQNMLRLYEYVLHCLSCVEAKKIHDFARRADRDSATSENHGVERRNPFADAEPGVAVQCVKRFFPITFFFFLKAVSALAAIFVQALSSLQAKLRGRLISSHRFILCASEMCNDLFVPGIY